MKKLYLLFSFLVIILHCKFSAAQDNTPLGARSAGMGSASVSLADAWSVQNNQAGLGFLKAMTGGIVYQSQFLLKELSTKAGAFAYPVRGGTFGLCVVNSGYSLFSRNKIGLSFGKSFGEKISAGISMDYLSTNISEYGKKNSFVAEAGLLAKPIKNLTIGLHVFNLTRTKLASYNDERIPTIMRLGIDYKFSDKVFCAIETEKDIDRKGILKAGVEYKPIDILYIRAGIATNPALSCFGMGVKFKQIRIDISSTYHSTLGFSPQIGLVYKFEQSTKAADATQTFK